MKNQASWKKTFHLLIRKMAHHFLMPKSPLKVGRWWLGLDPLQHIIVPVSASVLNLYRSGETELLGGPDRQFRSKTKRQCDYRGMKKYMLFPLRAEVFVWPKFGYVWPICLKHLPSSKLRVVKWNLKQVELELRSRAGAESGGGRGILQRFAVALRFPWDADIDANFIASHPIVIGSFLEQHEEKLRRMGCWAALLFF